MTVRAQFDGKVLVPKEPLDLPVGQVVDLDVTPVTEPPLGSAARLLHALRQSPPLTKEDAEALERAIEEGKLPVRYDGCFDEEV